MTNSAPPSTPEADDLAASIDRLTAELQALLEVLDTVREDFTCVTHNGVPVQPFEHVHVQRMALDPCADDWTERLSIERSTYAPNRTPFDADALARMSDELKATFEALAQRQLDVVLTALDDVREQLLAAVERGGQPPRDTAPASDRPATTPASPASADDPPAERPPPGRLF